MSWRTPPAADNQRLQPNPGGLPTQSFSRAPTQPYGASTSTFQGSGELLPTSDLSLPGFASFAPPNLPGHAPFAPLPTTTGANAWHGEGSLLAGPDPRYAYVPHADPQLMQPHPNPTTGQFHHDIHPHSRGGVDSFYRPLPQHMRERGPLLDPALLQPPPGPLFQPYDQRFQQQPGLLPRTMPPMPQLLQPAPLLQMQQPPPLQQQQQRPLYYHQPPPLLPPAVPAQRYAPHAMQRSVSPPLPRAGAPMRWHLMNYGAGVVPGGGSVPAAASAAAAAGAASAVHGVDGPLLRRVLPADGRPEGALWGSNSQPHRPRPQARQLQRECVHVLALWFFDHLPTPYPRREDMTRIMQESGLSNQQVVNWFANARRRNRLLWALNPQQTGALRDWLLSHRAQPYPSGSECAAIGDKAGLVADDVQRWIAAATSFLRNNSNVLPPATPVSSRSGRDGDANESARESNSDVLSARGDGASAATATPTTSLLPPTEPGTESADAVAAADAETATDRVTATAECGVVVAPVLATSADAAGSSHEVSGERCTDAAAPESAATAKRSYSDDDGHRDDVSGSSVECSREAKQVRLSVAPQPPS